MVICRVCNQACSHKILSAPNCKTLSTPCLKTCSNPSPKTISAPSPKTHSNHQSQNTQCPKPQNNWHSQSFDVPDRYAEQIRLRREWEERTECLNKKYNLDYYSSSESDSNSDPEPDHRYEHKYETHINILLLIY